MNKSKYIFLSLMLLCISKAAEDVSSWQYPGTEEEAFMDPATDEDILLEEYELESADRLLPVRHPKFEKSLSNKKAALQARRRNEATYRKEIADRLLPKYAEKQYALATIEQEIKQSPSSMLLYEKKHIVDERDSLKDQINSLKDQIKLRLFFANEKRRIRAQTMQDIKAMELSLEKWKRGDRLSQDSTIENGSCEFADWM